MKSILTILASVMIILTGYTQDNTITIKGEILNSDERTTIHIIGEQDGDTNTIDKGNYYKITRLVLDQSYKIVFVKDSLTKCLEIASSELLVHDAVMKYTMLLDIDWKDNDNYAYLCYSPIKRNFVLTQLIE